MTPQEHRKRPLSVLGRIAILAVLAAAVILSGKFTELLDLYGLAFVAVGGTALLLVSFDVRQIAAALRNAGKAKNSFSEDRMQLVFWQAAARNFWMAGILATLISFVIALADSEGGIAGISRRMASSLIPTVYGLILGVICLVPWMKLTEAGASDQPEAIPGESGKRPGKTITPSALASLAGYALMAALIVWAFIKTELHAAAPVFPVWRWVIYWPSLLVVVGGTFALALFTGRSALGRTFTLGFAVSGFVGSFLGIIQVLLGISARNIHEIAAAVTFILSSCFFALLGMMLIGAPLEDRAVKGSNRAGPSSLSRAAWFVFPLVTLILLVITFIIVVTPMKTADPHL